MDYITRKLIFLARYSYRRGYVASRGGNLSGRVLNDMLIKRSGVSFRDIRAKDIILVRNFHKKMQVPNASIDYLIHREIYLKTDAKYVLHCHPPSIVRYTIAISDNYIYPQDLEGRYYLRSGIPVVEGDHATIYRVIGELVSNHNIIIEKKHGVYVWGFSIKEVTNMLELAVEVISHIL